jgi:hypothetical protein
VPSGLLCARTAALRYSSGLPPIPGSLGAVKTRSRHITGLMEHKVHFVVAALGRDCDEFTLHIYASVAEQERKMISERVKAAKAVAKRRGQKSGLALRLWKQHPELTGTQVIERLGLKDRHLLGIYRALNLLLPGVAPSIQK